MRPTRAAFGAACLLGTLLSSSLASAEDSPACAKFKWSVARERSAFAAPELPVVASGQSLPGVAAAASLKLQPQTGVTFVKTPGRKPKIDPAFAGVFALAPIAAAGRYQVTLSNEAWIDVLQNGKEVRSSGVSDQPDCPEVRKSVRFPLQPGPITLQISGSAVDTLKLDVFPTE